MALIRPQVMEKIDDLHRRIDELIQKELHAWNTANPNAPMVDKLVQQERIKKACMPPSMRPASFYSTRIYWNR